MLLGNIVFDAKPTAVPYNYRISYKVSQLCLIMQICGWGGSCSLIKLQMISYALFSYRNMEKLIEFTNGKGTIPLVRFDPAVNKALTYAIAYGFIEQQKGNNFKLTFQGAKLAEQIKLVNDLMVKEIYDLNILAKNLTEKKINELVEKWRDFYVEN